MTNERYTPVDWGFVEPIETLEPTWQGPAMHHDELFALAKECGNSRDRFLGSLLIKEHAVQVVRIGGDMPAAQIIDVATGEPSTFEYANNIVVDHTLVTDGYYVPVSKNGFESRVVVDSQQPVLLTDVSTSPGLLLLSGGKPSTTSMFTSLAGYDNNLRFTINPNAQTASITLRQGIQNYAGAGMLLRIAVKSDRAEASLDMWGNDLDSNSRKSSAHFKFDDEGRPRSMKVCSGMITDYIFADTEFEGLTKDDAQQLDEEELEDVFMFLQDALSIDGNSTQLDIAETWQRGLDAVRGDHTSVADMLALDESLRIS